MVLDREVVKVGQVYTHPDTNCPLVITKVNRDRISFIGYDFDGEKYDFQSQFTGAAYQDSFLDRYTAIHIDELLNMDSELKEKLSSQTPIGVYLTQGYVVDNKNIDVEDETDEECTNTKMAVEETDDEILDTDGIDLYDLSPDFFQAVDEE